MFSQSQINYIEKYEENSKLLLFKLLPKYSNYEFWNKTFINPIILNRYYFYVLIPNSQINDGNKLSLRKDWAYKYFIDGRTYDRIHPGEKYKWTQLITKSKEEEKRIYWSAWNFPCDRAEWIPKINFSLNLEIE